MHQKEEVPVERKLDPILAHIDLTATDAEVSQYVLVAPIPMRPVVLQGIAGEAIADWTVTLSAGATTIAEASITVDADTVFEIDVVDVVIAQGTAVTVTLAPEVGADDLTGEQVHLSFGFTHSLVSA